MASLRKTLAINPDCYLVARPHEPDDPIELIDPPQAGERYVLLLQAAEQLGLNRLGPRWSTSELASHPRAQAAPIESRLDEPFLDHVWRNPVFWLLHEPAVLQEEGYMLVGDTAWYTQSEAGQAMHALIYEIRAIECRFVAYSKPVVFQDRFFDRVVIETTRSVPLMEFPAVFPRQSAPTVPGLDRPAPIDTDRVGDLVLATNAHGDEYEPRTWALLLDRGSHALALLSGDGGFPVDEHFRSLWNLECPPVSEMVAAAQAHVPSRP